VEINLKLQDFILNNLKILFYEIYHKIIKATTEKELKKNKTKNQAISPS